MKKLEKILGEQGMHIETQIVGLSKNAMSELKRVPISRLVYLHKQFGDSFICSNGMITHVKIN